MKYYLKFGLDAEEIAEREYLINEITDMLEDIGNIRKLRLIYNFVEDLVR